MAFDPEKQRRGSNPRLASNGKASRDTAVDERTPLQLLVRFLARGVVEEVHAPRSVDAIGENEAPPPLKGGGAGSET